MKKILYAEDNDGMRKMVSHFLSNVGFEIVAITDGDEAVELAKNETFDAILLDVTMLRLDGTKAAKIIRNNCPKNKFTPIVGLTGRTEQNEIDTCFKSGMDIVLSKPVDLEKLAKTLINDIKAASFELRNTKIATDNFVPKIIDVEVLKNYAKIAGTNSLEGILHDFSNLWPRKIGELYTSLIIGNYDAFARAGEELGAIAAGIGAGKISRYAAQAVSANNPIDRHQILPEIANACTEVQDIINALHNDVYENLKAA